MDGMMNDEMMCWERDCKVRCTFSSGHLVIQDEQFYIFIGQYPDAVCMSDRKNREHNRLWRRDCGGPVECLYSTSSC